MKPNKIVWATLLLGLVSLVTACGASGDGSAALSPEEARAIAKEGIDKLMSERDERPNVDSVMRPLRNSKTQRRVAPQGQASRSEKSIVFSRYQMPPQIE